MDELEAFGKARYEEILLRDDRINRMEKQHHWSFSPKCLSVRYQRTAFLCILMSLIFAGYVSSIQRELCREELVFTSRQTRYIVGLVRSLTDSRHING